MKKTREELERWCVHYQNRIEQLKKDLEHERKCGRDLSDHQKETVREIRKEFPDKTWRFLDSEIASAYSEYCEDNHAAGWTDTNLAKFAVWAFDGAINLHT